MANLNQVKAGKPVVISKLHGDEDLKRRLFELGLFEGAEVVVERKTPFGGPVMIRVQSAYFAVRRQDAEGIEVESL